MGLARSTLSLAAVMALSFLHCSREANAESAKPRDKSEKTMVVVALYTSEGCSSCPPADEALTALSTQVRDDGITVVPLSFHVDYWNYLGWADPYSSAANSERQQRLSRALSSHVYTPQAFIDGKTEIVGSDRSGLESNIVQSARTQKADVALTAKLVGRAITVDASSAALSPGTELVVAVTQARADSSVPRGENSGKHLVHTNVVRAWDLARPNAEQRARVQLSIPDSMPHEGAKIIAFVEDVQTMRVLSVNAIPLPAPTP